MLRLQAIMFLLLMFLSYVFGMPSDEFDEFTNIADEDILTDEDSLLMNTLPDYISGVDIQREVCKQSYVPKLAGINKSNENVINLNTWIEKGITRKCLTFNIYNDEMRQAAVALFRLFQSVESENYKGLKKWAEKYINNEMYLYALRLDSLYGANTPENSILPPFILNPRYFVNSEVITKAFTLFAESGVKGQDEIDHIQHGAFSNNIPGDKLEHFIIIDSNYSGWNLPNNGMEQEIKYFTEDVGLNSYYLGLHMLHPFWMSNEELEQSFSRHAEHYYYAHQQLMARYLLEKEHFTNKTAKSDLDILDYVPYLTYRNGLSFPARSCIRGDWDTEKTLLKSIDIAIKECIARGIIVMENGTIINMTDDTHIEELSKLIRGNFDGIRTAKVIRSVFGYGNNKPRINEYNPAPTLLHHPETSLRDPVYWNLIQYVLNYFTEYNAMVPYDLSQYETDDIKIIDTEDTTKLNITTYFHPYKFTLNYARNVNNLGKKDTHIAVRQKRLKHIPFEINLAFESSAKMLTVVRVYLGPQCGSHCWQEYSRFFELDTYLLDLEEGYNSALFSSKISRKHSFDNQFDSILLNPDITRKSNSYSIFKFPENLLIPRGLKNGLNLTLFVMLTPVDKDWLQPENNVKYERAVSILDSKPFGFPFHKPAVGFKESASNYRFYNITVYHKRKTDYVPEGIFSPNLY